MVYLWDKFITCFFGMINWWRRSQMIIRLDLIADAFYAIDSFLDVFFFVLIAILDRKEYKKKSNKILWSKGKVILYCAVRKCNADESRQRHWRTELKLLDKQNRLVTSHLLFEIFPVQIFSKLLQKCVHVWDKF